MPPLGEDNHTKQCRSGAAKTRASGTRKRGGKPAWHCALVCWKNAHRYGRTEVRGRSTKARRGGSQNVGLEDGMKQWLMSSSKSALLAPTNDLMV